MRKYNSVGLGVPKVLLPRKGVDMTKWAVVACDQFTSEPEYWKDVEKLVGDDPSTLHIIYPEVYLGESDADAAKRMTSIQSAMRSYVSDGVLEAHDGFVYVERKVEGRTRKGLMVCIDLEAYDYNKGSQSLVRATEGTILDRLPPRIKIREGAPLELPHIMVLVDDPEDEVMGTLAKTKGSLKKLYDFELMKGSGHLEGYGVEDEKTEKDVVSTLEKLAEPSGFAKKYALDGAPAVLLYAMGDGNHSLATAKAIWERSKEAAGGKAALEESATRFALVELVNVHDEALEFEPIHRVLFDVSKDFRDGLKGHFGERVTAREADSTDAMIAAVDEPTTQAHRIGYVGPEGCFVIEIQKPEANLPVGTIQPFVDAFVAGGGAREIDYVHGTDTVCSLGAKQGNIGLYLPAMSKMDLFKTVIVDGALPRKTFSMGEAHEKRFYVECREL